MCNMARSKHMLNNYGEIWRSLAYRVSIQGMVITTSPSPELLKTSFRFCAEDFSRD